MIADQVWCFTMSDLPNYLTGVQVDRRDSSIRRFDQRQAIHAQNSPLVTDSSRFLDGLRGIGAGVGARCVDHSHFFSRSAVDIIHVREFSRRRHKSDWLKAGIA